MSWPCTFPPLRERIGDIPLLASRFLERHDTHHTLTKEALDAMISYDWPGNVRELQNCIERMVALESNPLLHVGDLPTALQNHLAARRGTRMATAAVGAHGPSPGGQHSQSASSSGIIPLTELERRAILGALEYTKGDRVAAAYLLGIGRTTLYRKLKEYRLVS
jgi:two-component system response regulator HydG